MITFECLVDAVDLHFAADLTLACLDGTSSFHSEVLHNRLDVLQHNFLFACVGKLWNARFTTRGLCVLCWEHIAFPPLFLVLPWGQSWTPWAYDLTTP